MLDQLSPEARHLVLLLIGGLIAWLSTELPTRLEPLPASLVGAFATILLTWLTPLTRQYGVGAPDNDDNLDNVD